MTDTPPPHHALYNYFCEYDARGVIARFADPQATATPDTVTNFMGVRVPVKVYPPMLTGLAGTVEPIPNPGNWHADIAEWAAALLSVVRATGTYRIVELGCGWGCWLVNMGVAARKLGLEVSLIGIEGDANHLVNAREVLALNGFEDKDFRLVHGIAAPKPGKALFPDPQAGTAAWGGEAIFYPDAATLKRAQKDRNVQVLDCHTLSDLSHGADIDLVHVDIQGAEVDFVTGNMKDLDAHVHRVLIGTHGRGIEGRLTDHFLAHGWLMEMDRPVLAPLHAGVPRLAIDGVQLWRNPKWP